MVFQITHVRDMFISLLYVFLAIFGLGFLIFIHELGHYFMARRVGMRVETFSIGFGKPLCSWMYQDVKWQIGWLLFGGFVKIAGSELEADKNPYDIPDGFFGKKPIDRIKVALMGPLVNIVFALVAFTLLWSLGGRVKSFGEYTKKIGWVDTNSELYAHGIRPGDEITMYDDHPFQGAKDHFYVPMTSEGPLKVKGFKVDYFSKKKTPYEYTVNIYPYPEAYEHGIDRSTSGITHPATYITYKKLPDGKENPLPEGSPLTDSGIQYGDRIFWVNGEPIFSLQQLNYLLSGNDVLLTVKRDRQTFLRRVPRLKVQELRPDPLFREELTDWQFAADLQGQKIQNLYAIPYNLSNDAVVDGPLKFIDKEKQAEIFPSMIYSPYDSPLQVGDRIIAVNGKPIKHAHELLSNIQNYGALVILERNGEATNEESWTQADANFDSRINPIDLQAIINGIGTSTPITRQGKYVLLPVIHPKTRMEFSQSPERQAQISLEAQAQRKAVTAIEDPDKRSQALKLWEKQENRLLLGLPRVQDEKVDYNPSPFALFINVFEEIWRTLVALVSGTFSPKWMAGPIGIVQMVHDSSMGSIKEALYWLGAISLNLGILNLLPIPVLDGGTIVICLAEMLTGRRMQPKMLEKIIIPFAALLIIFFIYATYNDLLRLFS